VTAVEFGKIAGHETKKLPQACLLFVCQTGVSGTLGTVEQCPQQLIRL